MRWIFPGKGLPLTATLALAVALVLGIVARVGATPDVSEECPEDTGRKGRAWFENVQYSLNDGETWTPLYSTADGGPDGTRKNLYVSSSGDQLVRAELYGCLDGTADASNSIKADFTCEEDFDGTPCGLEEPNWNEHDFAPSLPPDTTRQASIVFQHNVQLAADAKWKLTPIYDNGPAPQHGTPIRIRVCTSWAGCSG